MDERISHELKEWRTNFVSVQSYMDDLVVSRGKLRSVEEKVRVLLLAVHQKGLYLVTSPPVC